MKTVTIHCLSESMSPITHMSGSVGNVAVVAREPVVTGKGLCWLPFLSGNALRHRCAREPGMIWLIEEYDLCGKLNLDQLNFLFHGGNLTQSNSRENTKRIAEMYRTWPLLRLLGASLPDQILAGSMDVWRGVLVCEENRDSLVHLPEGRLHSAERFVSEYQYTRGDAKKKGIQTKPKEKEAKQGELIEDSEEKEEKSNLMIFSGQSVQRGAMWQHGFVCKHVSDIEIGALLWSIRLWQQTGGTIGGQASRGHGRLKCNVLNDGNLDQDKLCREYVDYARGMKEDAVQWLMEAWGK